MATFHKIHCNGCVQGKSYAMVPIAGVMVRIDLPPGKESWDDFSVGIAFIEELLPERYAQANKGRGRSTKYVQLPADCESFYVWEFSAVQGQGPFDSTRFIASAESSNPHGAYDPDKFKVVDGVAIKLDYEVVDGELVFID